MDQQVSAGDIAGALAGYKPQNQQQGQQQQQQGGNPLGGIISGAGQLLSFIPTPITRGIGAAAVGAGDLINGQSLVQAGIDAGTSALLGGGLGGLLGKVGGKAAGAVAGDVAGSVAGNIAKNAVADTAEGVAKNAVADTAKSAVANTVADTAENAIGKTAGSVAGGLADNTAGKAAGQVAGDIAGSANTVKPVPVKIGTAIDNGNGLATLPGGQTQTIQNGTVNIAPNAAKPASQSINGLVPGTPQAQNFVANRNANIAAQQKETAANNIASDMQNAQQAVANAPAGNITAPTLATPQSASQRMVSNAVHDAMVRNVGAQNVDKGVSNALDNLANRGLGGVTHPTDMKPLAETYTGVNGVNTQLQSTLRAAYDDTANPLGSGNAFSSAKNIAATHPDLQQGTGIIAAQNKIDQIGVNGLLGEGYSKQDLNSAISNGLIEVPTDARTGAIIGTPRLTRLGEQSMSADGAQYVMKQAQKDAAATGNSASGQAQAQVLNNLARGMSDRLDQIPVSDTQLQAAADAMRASDYAKINPGAAETLAKEYENLKGTGATMSNLRQNASDVVQVVKAGGAKLDQLQQMGGTFNDTLAGGALGAAVGGNARSTGIGLALGRAANSKTANNAIINAGTNALARAGTNGSVKTGGTIMSMIPKKLKVGAGLAGLAGITGLGLNAANAAGQSADAQNMLNDPNYQDTQSILANNAALQRQIGQQEVINAAFAPTFAQGSAPAMQAAGQQAIANSNQQQQAQAAAQLLLQSRAKMGQGGILGSLLSMVPGTSQNSYANAANSAQAQLNSLGVAGAAPGVSTSGSAQLSNLVNAANTVGQF